MCASRFTRLAGGLLLVTVLAACGETTREEADPELLPGVTVPAIGVFQAAPEVIEAGARTTLHWTARDAVSIAIVDGNGTPVPTDGLAVDGDSVTVQPTETTSYTLTATGSPEVAVPAWRTLTVFVLKPRTQSPVIEQFTASPDTVAGGDQVVLSWRTTDATEIAIEDNADVSVDVTGLDPASGQVTVRPSCSPTVYFLTAVGAGGRATDHIVVTVEGSPRVTRFDVVPLAPVHPGDSITLNWETSNTDRVVIRQGEAIFLDTTTELSGSRTVTLDENASFTLEASGVGGTATAETLAQVGPDVAEFSASERVVRANDPVTITWAVTDADRAVIDGPGGYHMAIPAAQLASGSATINVAEAGDFVLTAFREDVPRTATIAIDVTLAPRIRPPLVVDPVQVTASPSHPGTVTLSWTQDGATSCTIFANTTPVDGYVDFACGETGSATIQLANSASLRLVASNEHGSHALTAGVEAFPPATIAAFASAPTRRLSPGDSVELSWEVLDAVSVVLEKDGAVIPIDSTNFVGSTSDSVMFDSVYVLTAQNALGFPTSAQLIVRAGAPAILSAEAEPDFVAIGAAFELRWLADGGDNLTVNGPGGELLSITDPARIDNGSATLLAPVEAGEYVYTVAIENGGGNVSADVTLRASDGPMIRSVVAAPGEITLGDSFTVTWSVANDAASNTPTLTLVDDYLHDYTTELASKDPNSGSLTITPEEEGRHEYTFTATTEPTRMVAVETFAIEVTVPPFLHTFTATPDLVSTQGGQVVPQVELAWTSENAVELSLWEADEFGNAIPPAFHRVSLAAGDPQATLDSGNLTVNPTATTRYIARARNRVGTQVEKLVKVIVDPPEVVSFVATPAEVLEGVSSTLAWTTRNADYVRFEPSLVSEIADPYIDISATGTAVTREGTEDAGRWSVTFPQGFTFPWFGTTPTGLVATADGWITFNTAYASTDFSNTALPDSGNTHLAMAVFWDDGKAYTTTTQLLWELRQSQEGQHLVIQWHDIGVCCTPTGNLNYQLVLWENGNFDYRYASMTHTTAGRADGNSATIGYQSPDQSQSHMILYNTAMPGGLSNRSLRYQLAQPANGSVVVSPLSTTTYTITAVSDDGEDQAETEVIVWKTPVISSVGIDPVAPSAGQPFTINWRVENASQIRVLSETGSVICIETDPALIPVGSCTYSEPAPGQKTYTIEAANGPPGAPLVVTTSTATAVVVSNLAITSFELLPGEFVDAGEQLTLNWSSSGAVYMALLACAPGNPTACTDITPAAADPNAGTISLAATASTEFWLYIYDMYTREVFASRNVWVGVATVDSFTASSTMIPAGGSVVLSWTTTDAESVSLKPAPPLPPPADVSATAPFIDISSTGNSVTLDGTEDSGRYTVFFPGNFTFPWFGDAQTGLVATTDGWLTFNTAFASSSYSNTALPGTNTNLALAPFWDDGKAYPTTGLFWELRQSPEGQHLIVQWQDTGICCTPTGNLSYQVVLWESGDFDFRYGSMTGPDQGRADGNSATIGFRSPDGSAFHEVSYNTAFPGGLSNRSWRFRPSMDPDGSLVVTPENSTTYRLCATNESLYLACEEVRVIVVKPGDLLFSEVMARPTDPNAEWFELRNVTLDAIDLGGWILSSGAGELYTIPTAPPVIVPAGGYAVFARSGDPLVNGGLVSPHVYGNALTLVDGTDILQLSMGPVTIDSILWDVGWTIPATGSIELDVSKMARDPAANDVFASWCAPTTTYGNGTFAGSPGSIGNGCNNTGPYQYYLFDPVAGMPFIDISATGIDESSILGSVYYTDPIPLGFAMPYFDDVAVTMQISKHGYVAFPNQTSYYSSNSAIPNATTMPNGFVAPFWDALTYTSGESSIVYERRTINGRKAMIIQWTKAAFSSTSYGSVDFQIQLWENGDIVFGYRNLIKINTTYHYLYGASATIGIESIDGSQAIQVHYGTSSTGPGPIREGTTYHFVRRTAPPAP